MEKIREDIGLIKVLFYNLIYMFNLITLHIYVNIFFRSNNIEEENTWNFYSTN